ncbi:MAG TPA: DEAD/DEAH box helicase [Vicinamibacterales bacterium]|nr:DEAD/DEAH box helicase [Vicinamibacterales bacterium]
MLGLTSTPSFTLRPYQDAAVTKGLAYLQDPALRDRHGLIVAPTGSGKSLVIAGIATQLRHPCLVFQPSKEILEQNMAKLQAYGYRPAVFSASFGKREIGSITLATIGSVIRHIHYFREMPYVLVDECHGVNAKEGMYKTFFSALPHVRILGLTATPYRLVTDGYGGSILKFLTRTRPRVFRDVVQATDINYLFREGYLSPLVYDERPVIKRDRLRLNTTGADYTDASVQQHFHEIDFAGYLLHVVSEQLRAGRKNVLVFTRFVEESQQLVDRLPAGTAAIVSADTPADERARILEDFKAGRIRVVSNVGVLAVGFDYPGLECVVLARPSVSLALYYQMVGRDIRPVYAPGMPLDTLEQRHAAIAAGPKPRAYVVDLVGLVQLFGKIEHLKLRRGGKTGEQWQVFSETRPLTNVYFGQRDQDRSDAHGAAAAAEGLVGRGARW